MKVTTIDHLDVTLGFIISNIQRLPMKIFTRHTLDKINDLTKIQKHIHFNIELHTFVFKINSCNFNTLLGVITPHKCLNVTRCQLT